MKHIVGWRDSRWPIPSPLQALVGLVPYRDPEAYLEARRTAREAARERKAIQAEGRKKGRRTQRAASPQPAPHLDPPPPLNLDEPTRAATGWYRIGATFYRIGSGPLPTYGLIPVDPAWRPATYQGLLF